MVPSRLTLPCASMTLTWMLWLCPKVPLGVLTTSKRNGWNPKMDGVEMDCSFFTWISSPSNSSFRSGFFWLVLHCTRRSQTHPRGLRWNALLLCPNKRWWRTRSVSGAGWCDSRDEVVTYTHTHQATQPAELWTLDGTGKYMNVIWNKMTKVMKYHEVFNHIKIW